MSPTPSPAEVGGGATGDAPSGGAVTSTLSLAPDPSAPRAARGWVASVLEGWPPAGADNASLIVSELVTNALLHASTSVELRCTVAATSARFEVRDGRHAVPTPKPYAPDAPTGRGMLLVGMLTDEWGVDDLESGKAVWCVVSANPDDPSPPSARPPASVGVSRATEGPPASAGADAVCVRILALPVSVYLEAEEHNDALMRELTLIAQSSASPGGLDVPHRLLDLAEEVRRVFGPTTSALRDQVERARLGGEATVDLELWVPNVGWDKLGTLADQLDELDRYCDDGELLTLSSSPSLRRFRRWYADQVVAQLRGLPATPWPQDADEAEEPAGSPA